MFNQTKLQLKPSNLLAGAILLPYLAALFLVGTHEIYWLAKLTLMLFIAGLGIYHIVHIGLLRTSTSIQAVSITSSEIFIHYDSPEKYRAQLLGKALVSRFFCMLYLKNESGEYCAQHKLSQGLQRHQQLLVICPSNVTCPESYRRLRVFLRFGQYKHIPIKTI